MEIDIQTPIADRIEQILQKYGGSSSISRRVAIFEHACSQLDMERIEGLRAKWLPIIAKQEHIDYVKYFDLAFWFWVKSAVIETCNLDNGSKKNVLDLGSGPGHFIFMCEAFGHNATGIDLEYDVFRDICYALHTDYHAHPISPASPLPDLDMRYDLATALMLKFDEIPHEQEPDCVRYWSGGDWGAFFSELTPHLKPDAEIFLELNQHHQLSGPLALDSVFVQACLDQGALQLSKDNWLRFENANELQFDADYPSKTGRLPQPTRATRNAESNQ